MIRLKFELINATVGSFWNLQAEGYQNPILFQSGYTYYSFMPNLGVLNVAIIMLLTATVASVLIPIILPARCSNPSTCLDKLSPKVTDLTVRFGLEAYFEVILCVMINLSQPHMREDHRISVVAAVVVGIVCLSAIVCTSFLSYAVNKNNKTVSFEYIKTLLYGMNLYHPERAAAF